MTIYFNGYHAEGEEPDNDEDMPEEGDLIVNWKNEVFEVGGKFRGKIPEDSDASEFLYAIMDEDKFWPDTWWESDHGNIFRLHLKKRK
jgi:hypothetical protein